MNEVPNSFKTMLWKGQIAGLTDTFKIVLMQIGFTFNKDNHHAYADISTWELPTGNGYTNGGQALTGAVITTDNVEDRAELVFNNAQWTASGGPISTVGAIVFDDDTLVGGGDDYTDAIVAFLDANGVQTVPDGAALTVSSIMFTGEDIS